jgi:hypothetical protein
MQQQEIAWMRPRYDFRITALAAVALLVACSDSATELATESRLLGILQLGLTSGQPAFDTESSTDRSIRWNLPPGERIAYPPSVIEAPDTVTVGQAFQAVVNTIGPSGCWTADGLEVQTAGRVVGMTAWDRHSGADVCTTVLTLLAHPTNLTLDQTGEWTLKVTGRRVRDGQADDMVTAERTVYVRAGS